MFKKVGRVLLAAAMAAGLVGIAHIAATDAEACTNFVRLRENASGTGQGDAWTQCKDTVLIAGVADLNTISHTQEVFCNSAALYRFGDDWDDCASSVDFFLPTDKCVVFFNDPNGGGPVTKSRRGTGTNYTVSNFSQAGNDKTTSFYYGNYGSYGENCKIGPSAPAGVAGRLIATPYDQ